MKKLITTLVALSLLASALPVPALAAGGAESATGDAGITFEEGDDPGIVDPPPTVTPGIKGSALKFGTRDLSAQNEIYESTDPSVQIDEDDRYAGLVVSNPNKNITWEVDVKISEFKLNGVKTLDNFELVLHKDAVEGNYLQPPIISDSLPPLAGGGAAVKAMKHAENASAGTFGVNFSGELKVAAGTADEGEAKAIMTWTFVSA